MKLKIFNKQTLLDKSVALKYTDKLWKPPRAVIPPWFATGGVSQSDRLIPHGV